MIHRDCRGVLADWSQAQQHVTSLPSGRLIDGWLWQASRVELAADQPQRSFAPCGNQCATPTNSRKQTIGAVDPLRSAAAKFPRYVIIGDITHRTFARRVSSYALFFARKQPCRPYRPTEKRWKTADFSVSFSHDLLKGNWDIVNNYLKHPF